MSSSDSAVAVRVATTAPPRAGGEVRHGSAGHVLDLIRRTPGGLTRADVLERTGLARSTVTARLATLQTAGLIAQGGPASAARGRPPSHFHFRDDNGTLLLADAGAGSARVALTDLGGKILHEIDIKQAITIGPEAWLGRVQETFDRLLRKARRSRDFVKGIALALPGPIDFASATVVRPPIMIGWDGYPIRDWFAPNFNCPVIVDNDANAMTVGEYRSVYPDRTSMMMVKIGTGIGAGIIAGGTIYRGEDGAAGDIGHIQLNLPGFPEPPRCRCGNYGCVEAFAGGWALVRDLRDRGKDVDSVNDLVALVRSGDPDTRTMTHEAGRTVGIGLADAVSLLNPGVVVIGGQLGVAADNMVAGIREMVYSRSLGLATRQLEIVQTVLGPQAGLTGLATILTDHIFDPALVDSQLG